MAGKQRAALEEKARGLLSGMGMGHVTVVEPRIGRPMPARLEIVHPLLARRARTVWGGLMKKMRSDGTAAAVMLELAQMTRQLREGRIRATADYGLGTIVVSWGAPQEADLDGVRQSLASRAGGRPVSDEAILIAWAALPDSEVDGMTGALEDAKAPITPLAGTRGAAAGRRRPPPPTSRPSGPTR